jgi:hypothetical protein
MRFCRLQSVGGRLIARERDGDKGRRINSTKSRSHAMNRFWSFAYLVGAWLLAMTFLGPSAHSQSESKPVRWEYRTETVETALLSQKMTEWGNDSWDVFSVERADSILDQDGGTKLKVLNYQLTARRVLK